MNSSTSSSDASPRGGGGWDAATSWRRFTQLWAGVAVGGLVAIVVIAAALDPYDTGRFALVDKPGTVHKGPRTGHVSRIRDPAFAAPIIGNSHIQLVSPERLTAASGVAFVSLAIPATGSSEQIAILDYWLARRGPPPVLIVGLDGLWCRLTPEFPGQRPFPYWLYATGGFEYLRGLIRSDTVEDIGRRLRFLAGRTLRERPDGFWDYEQGRVWAESAVRTEVEKPAWLWQDNLTGRYPGFERLWERVQRLPASTRVVLVAPPLAASALAQPGSAGARADAACKAEIARLAASRSNTAFVDWRIDVPETRDLRHFWDQTHYASGLARRIEADIAAALAAMR